jgi:hypothetical protein
MKRLLATVLALVALQSSSFAQQPAHYVGELVVAPLDDGVHMRLVQPFGYVDSLGRRWEVPAEWVVDGASIPSPLWSIIGSPWTGKYRNASVVHDYFCDTKSRGWEHTHRVFYEAMLTSGVELRLAKLMYFAVYRFGPRWDAGILGCRPGGHCMLEDRLPFDVKMVPKLVPTELDAMRERLLHEDLDVETIEVAANTSMSQSRDLLTILGSVDGEDVSALEPGERSALISMLIPRQKQ